MKVKAYHVKRFSERKRQGGGRKGDLRYNAEEKKERERERERERFTNALL